MKLLCRLLCLFVRSTGRFILSKIFMAWTIWPKIMRPQRDMRTLWHHNCQFTRPLRPENLDLFVAQKLGYVL
ncbi:hypothetical protein BDW68DRAFT_166522 [Aspergillus falconensis]